MKIIQTLLPTMSLLAIAYPTLSQGWVAEIDLDFNHELYAYEKIEAATVTFSGVTVTGSSSTSTVNFVLKGIGPMSGNLNISAQGIAWDPYDPADATSKYITGNLSGNYTASCKTGFFESKGETIHEQILVHIIIFPRMDISSFLQECDHLTLTTSTCSNSFYWEVSDDLHENFKPIGGKETASITITREELVALGFDDPFGRKYFRVTGRYMTTSQLQAVDIYYPGPSTSLSTTPPKCYNGDDGSVGIDIRSPAHSAIDDFVVTLFQNKLPLEQNYLQSQSAIIFTGLTAGNYSVKIENNSSIDIYGSCWSEHSFMIAEPEPVTISSASITDFNGFQVSCSGASDGAITVTPSGGTQSYINYEWSPSVSVGNHADQLSPGTYSLKVKDSNECWSGKYHYVIAAPEALTIDLISAGGKNGYDVSCFNKPDGEIITEITGGTQPYRFEWSDGIHLANRTEMASGSFRLEVEDANNCEAGASIVLTAPDPISFTIAELAGIVCPGDNSGVLEIQSLTNTIGHVEYRWSSGETHRQVENKAAGTYFATVSDEQGCSETRTVVLEKAVAYTVEINAVADYSGYPIRCNGDATGALQAIVLDEGQNEVEVTDYTWYRNGQEFLSGLQAASSISNLPAGVYRADVTYRGVCKAAGTFILNQPEPLEVVIAATSYYNGAAISCAGANDGSVEAQTRGGVGTYTFSWSTGETGSQLTNIGPDNYMVTATDDNGCTATAAMTVFEPDTLKASVRVLSDYHGQPISCADAADARLKAVTTGGTFPIHFSWNNGQTTAELSDVASGDYRVVATDVNGCKSTANATLSNPTPIKVNIDHSDHNGYGVSCHSAADGFVVASGEGGAGNYAFQWAGAGNDGPLYSSLPANTYRVTVRDQNGCETTAAQVITEPPPLVITVVGFTNVTCYGGSDGEIQLRSSGGVGNYSYALSGQPWQSEPALTDLSSRNYRVAVRDENGCERTVAQVISEPAPISITFQNIEPALCGDPKGRVSAVVSGGTSPYQLEWKNHSDEIVGKEASVSGLQSGIVVLSVADTNLCSAQASVGIPARDGPIIRQLNVSSPTCSYTADGSASVEAAGKEPLFYRWPDGQTTPQVSDLSKGQYLVEVTDAENCTTVTSVVMPAPDSLIVDLAESASPSCHGDCNGALLAKASGGSGQYEYHWTNSTGPSLENICAGEYAVTVIDGRRCTTSATFTLLEPATIELSSTTLKSPSCPDDCNGSISLHAAGGSGKLTYEWSTGEEGPVIENLCDATYTVTIQDANECSVSRAFKLDDPPQPSLNLGGSVMLCEGQFHTLDAGPNWKSHLWGGQSAFKSSDRRVSISEAGAYWLAVIDDKGCVARDTFLLKTSHDLLNARFLLASEAVVHDTLVLIDISWPLPESINWILPSEMKRISDFGDVVFAKFERPGTYEVALSASLGECRDIETKTIMVADDNRIADDGRLGHETFVKEFSLYPNPNNGEFDIVVELQHESPISVTIWNILTSRQVGSWNDYGRKNYLKKVNLRPLSSGTYSLRLDYGKGFRYLRFVVE